MPRTKTTTTATPTITSKIPARKRGTTTNDKRKSRLLSITKLFLVFAFLMLCFLFWCYWILLIKPQQQQQQFSFPLEPNNAAEFPPPHPQQQQQQQQISQRREKEVAVAAAPAAARKPNNNNNNNRKEGSNKIDRIVEILLDLARMPSDQLKSLLEGKDDPFRLEELEQGRCPFPTTTTSSSSIEIEWLPERPKMSKTASEWFKNNNNPSSSSSLSDGKNNNNNPTEMVVVVYYEHLSKAGGTSFCKLAQTNMKRQQVPNYYCMPSEPNQPDARVGSWTTDKLQKYILSHPHRLLSNEWEPFNIEFLREFQQQQSSSSSQQQPDNADYYSSSTNKRTKTTTRIHLLFVTSIRDPINRLLSAYKFWGKLHNQERIKPTLPIWLKRYANRAKQWKIGSSDFAANVGRFNFATWKFSGGNLPVSKIQISKSEELLSLLSNSDGAASDLLLEEAHDDDENSWKESFVTAIESMSKFDLIIPMEFLSNHTKPVTDLLGWKNFDKSHVVPSGKVMNNEATNELSISQYDKLWKVNKLDVILYHWSSAIYLARLYCN